jgi:hypothetical protein
LPPASDCSLVRFDQWLINSLQKVRGDLELERLAALLLMLFGTHPPT